MLLCTLPMIHGCAPSSAGKIDIGPWATQDLAPVRCPPVDQRAVAEFKRTTKAPASDGVTKRASQEWIDAYEVAERRKNAAGQRLAKEYEACRAGGDTSPLDAAAKALGTS